MWWFLHFGVVEGSVDNSSVSIVVPSIKIWSFNQQKPVDAAHTRNKKTWICAFFNQLEAICQMGLNWMILIDNRGVLCHNWTNWLHVTEKQEQKRLTVARFVID